MPKVLTLLAVSAVCAASFSQSFECYPLGPLPTDPSMSCEGVASNGLGFLTGVVSTASCGFPTAGVNYVLMDANGPVTPPNGGPFPWPVSTAGPACEVRVPIPSGASVISFDWEYFNAEGYQSVFNDGMAVAVVDSSGALLQQLVYADNQVALGACFNLAASGTEIAPSGIQSFAGALPPLTPCAYVSFVCWNGLDNVLPSHAYVDNIQFNSAVQGCPVPCFVVVGTPTLAFSSPSGVGCILVTMTNLPGGGQYFMPVSLTAGIFPNGFLFGLDIGFPELALEINTGPPFVGALSGTGCSPGSATIGQFCGLPSGLTVYAVALGFPAGSSFPSANTAAASYTIP